jgi:hypothetical protein
LSEEEAVSVKRVVASTSNNVKEIEVGKMEDSNRHWAGITMRNGEFKNVYGFMKSIKVEFD